MAIYFELKFELENELTHFFELELTQFENELTHLSLTHFFELKTQMSLTQKNELVPITANNHLTTRKCALLCRCQVNVIKYH